MSLIKALNAPNVKRIIYKLIIPVKKHVRLPHVRTRIGQLMLDYNFESFLLTISKSTDQIFTLFCSEMIRNLIDNRE